MGLVDLIAKFLTGHLELFFLLSFLAMFIFSLLLQ